MGKTISKFKQLTDPNKVWVNDILSFDNYDDYIAYTKNFDYYETSSLKMFLTNVLNQLICNHENPLYYEIEKNVEISFGTTLEFEKIHFCYVDSRNSQKEITYHTVKSPDPYTFPKIRKEGDPATSTYVEYDSHTILNKPIYHYCEIKYYYEKNKKILDQNKTFKLLLDSFIVFANVIDIEHKQMVWLMLKEGERKLLIPKPPNVRNSWI